MQRYRSKVSGPLLDRIDIQVEVPTSRYQELASKDAGDPPRTFASESTRLALSNCYAFRSEILILLKNPPLILREPQSPS